MPLLDSLVRSASVGFAVSQAELPEQARELGHRLHLMVRDLLPGTWLLLGMPPGAEEHGCDPEQLCGDDVGINPIPDDKAAIGPDFECRSRIEEDLGVRLS